MSSGYSNDIRLPSYSVAHVMWMVGSNFDFRSLKFEENFIVSKTHFVSSLGSKEKYKVK